MKGLLGRILMSSGVIAVIVLICKGFGGLEKLLLTVGFPEDGSLGWQPGIYLAMAMLVVLFFDVMRMGLIPAFLPEFQEERERVGEAASWRLPSTFVNIIVPALLVLVAVVMVWPQQVIDLVIPGFRAGQGENAEQGMAFAAKLLRIMFVGGAFLIVGGITYGVLNSYKRFAAPAWGDLAFKLPSITVLVALVVLAKTGRGEAFLAEHGIEAVSWGIMLGCMALLATHLVALRKKLRFYRPVVDLRNPATGRVLIAAAPLIVTALAYHGRRIVDLNFAMQAMKELGTGSQAYLGIETSYRLIEFPYRVALEPLSFVILPLFATLALQADRREFARTVHTAVRAILLLLVPASVGLILLREPVAYVFGKGWAQWLMAPTSCYALGLAAFGLDIVLMRTWYSMKRVWLPGLLEVATLGLHIGLNYWLPRSLFEPGGLFGVGGALGAAGGAGVAAVTALHARTALAFALARIFKVVMLFLLLKKPLASLELKNNLVFMTKCALATAAMAVVAYFVYHRAGDRLGMDTVRAVTAEEFGMKHRAICALNVLVPAAAGGVVYLVGILALRVGEVKALIEMAKQRKAAKASGGGEEAKP